MKDLILDDSFKVVTLLASLLFEMDDSVEIITFRNLTYNQVKAKLNELANKDHTKDEEDKALTTRTIKRKGKKVNKEKGCTWYKKHFPKSNYKLHN